MKAVNPCKTGADNLLEKRQFLEVLRPRRGFFNDCMTYLTALWLTWQMYDFFDSGRACLTAVRLLSQ